MYYLITKEQSYRTTTVDVLEFATEEEAVEQARKHPRKVVAIFEGQRLVPKKEKKQVTQEVITGFEEYADDEFSK